MASLSRRCGFVEKRGVCNVHIGELHDSSLEVQEGFKSSLGDLSLIWSVRGIPFWVLKNISSDNTWGVCSIISLSDKTLVDGVVSRKLSHSFEHEGLRVDAFKNLAIMSESRFWRKSDFLRHDFTDEFFHGVKSQRLQRSLRRVVAVTDVSVDEIIREFKLLGNILVFHDVDLLLKDGSRNEHLVVHLKSGHLTGGRRSCGDSTGNGGSGSNEALGLYNSSWSLQCLECEFFHKHFFCS